MRLIAIKSGAVLVAIVVAVLGVRAATSIPSSPSARPSTGVRGAGIGKNAITICGTHFCRNGASWYLYGASEYQSTGGIGIDYPKATISLARTLHLNTIRIVNFYNDGDPSFTPYDPKVWKKVDVMIADAKAAGLQVDLGLSDYRRILWNNCINPYTYDWDQLMQFVASRSNTVTGKTYGKDAAIAFISLAGEPLPVGSHTFTTPGGKSCTITYSGQDLLNFYTRTLAQWQAQGTTVLGNSGGMGYLNFNSGIPWQSIMALSTNRFCDIKTYGGMLAFVPTVAAYCHSINKPFMDEEYGWTQSMGDAQRAQAFHGTATSLRANGATGQEFWNLGEQMASTTYDVGPGSPLTLTAIAADAPGN